MENGNLPNFIPNVAKKKLRDYETPVGWSKIGDYGTWKSAGCLGVDACRKQEHANFNAHTPD